MGEHQQDVARRLFYPPRRECGTINGEQFTEDRTSAPILATPPARVESEVERIVNTDGDHAVVILRALNAECLGQVRPLTIAGTPWQYGG